MLPHWPCWIRWHLLAWDTGINMGQGKAVWTGPHLGSRVHVHELVHKVSSLKEKWWYKITALREPFEPLWNFQPAPVGTFKRSSVPAAYRILRGLLAQGNPGKYSVQPMVLPMCLWKGIDKKRSFFFFHLVLDEINLGPNKRGGQTELVFPLPGNSTILPPPPWKIAVWLKSCQGSTK